VEPAAKACILPLGVLPDTQDVDIRRSLVTERARDAIQDLDGPEIDVLVEPLSDREKQPPERHVVRYSREADRSEVDRVGVG
jgi:hypothetical protein